MMQKKVVMTYLIALLSWHLPGGTEEYKEEAQGGQSQGQNF
jgi:hypothetical protein